MNKEFFIITWNMDVLVQNADMAENKLSDLTLANQVLQKFRLNKGDTNDLNQKNSDNY